MCLNTLERMALYKKGESESALLCLSGYVCVGLHADMVALHLIGNKSTDGDCAMSEDGYELVSVKV